MIFYDGLNQYYFDNYIWETVENFTQHNWEISAKHPKIQRFYLFLFFWEIQSQEHCYFEHFSKYIWATDFILLWK